MTKVFIEVTMDDLKRLDEVTMLDLTSKSIEEITTNPQSPEFKLLLVRKLLGFNNWVRE